MLAKGFRRIKRARRKMADEPFVAAYEAAVDELMAADGVTVGDDGETMKVLLAEATDLAWPEIIEPEAPVPTRTYYGDSSLVKAVEEMKKPKPLSKTVEDYKRAFEIEKAHRYKVMDALEDRFGYAIDRKLLEISAQVLACPVKRNPPNWQHGRLVYALARHRLQQGGEFVFLDIGTAKGFSAVCMALAVCEHHSKAEVAQPERHIWSVDVIDPASNEPRNSIKDGQIKRGIWDYCEDFVNPDRVPYLHFVQDGDTAHIGFLSRTDRIGFAFVDGDHSYHGVSRDIGTIYPRQDKGDIILFDDMQIPEVAQAVKDAIGGCGVYDIEKISLIPSRSYAIAVRQ